MRCTRHSALPAWTALACLALAPGCVADDPNAVKEVLPEGEGEGEGEGAAGEGEGEDLVSSTGYRWLAIASWDQGWSEEQDLGPDIDAVEVCRGAADCFYATRVGDQTVYLEEYQQPNLHADPTRALGPPDALDGAGSDGYVSLGTMGHYLMLSFDREIRVGDQVIVYEAASRPSAYEPIDEYGVYVGAEDGVDRRWISGGQCLGLCEFFVLSPSPWEASLVPELSSCADLDHDGYGTGDRTNCAGHSGQQDCDDADPAVHPCGFEVAGDGKDGDCGGGDGPSGLGCPWRPCAALGDCCTEPDDARIGELFRAGMLAGLICLADDAEDRYLVTVPAGESMTVRFGLVREAMHGAPLLDTLSLWLYPAAQWADPPLAGGYGTTSLTIDNPGGEPLQRDLRVYDGTAAPSDRRQDVRYALYVDETPATGSPGAGNGP